MDYPTYPDFPGVRAGSPETSYEAAEALAPKLGRLQQMVFKVIAEQKGYGLTPEEAANLLDLDRCSVQPRFTELKEKGMIVQSCLRRVNASSRKRVVVWVALAYAPKIPGDAMEA